MEEVAMCVVTTDTGHVLVNWAPQDTPISAPHLGSLAATLQQFSHGQSLSVLQYDVYSIVVARSPLVPVLCCLVSTSSTNLAAVKLVGSFILHECFDRHSAIIMSIVQQANDEAESMAHAYTLTTALLGQSSHETHNDLMAFQSTCIIPCLANDLNHKIAQALSDANLSRSVRAVWIYHIDSPEPAFQWTPPNAASVALAPWLPHVTHTFHQHLTARARLDQRQLTLQPLDEPMDTDVADPSFIALNLLNLDGFCVAVLYSADASLATSPSGSLTSCDPCNPLCDGSGTLVVADIPWLFRLNVSDPAPHAAVQAVLKVLSLS
ncbi:hypothetical protein H310_00551 [Aphanomyces invadans]|uniref:Uncharacterized protein n=1 Tax=Aphanomyces invadans TaxID=157072 RepID=A0A024UUI1_9STRA|nr:hypothetical protein H310_00551 [Aphanomyces invadans]ETW10181.1 hypothetical protein H310_00551 [Aphanomyces invadans]|eukprot:XP_008861592.1 hypothetical protein H310_00551 [Aphanomyces invadans]